MCFRCLTCVALNRAPCSLWRAHVSAWGLQTENVTVFMAFWWWLFSQGCTNLFCQLKVVKCCICLQLHAVNEAISQMLCKLVQDENCFLIISTFLNNVINFLLQENIRVNWMLNERQILGWSWQGWIFRYFYFEKPTFIFRKFKLIIAGIWWQFKSACDDSSPWWHLKNLCSVAKWYLGAKKHQNCNCQI